MLKWEYVNRTCMACGRKLRLVARLRGGNFLLQCQDTEKIKGLTKDKRCRLRLKQFMVAPVGLNVDESPDLGAGDRPLDAVED